MVLTGGLCAASCDRFAAVHPQIGIEVTHVDGRTTFSFGDCRGLTNLPINEIAVYAGNDGPEGRPPICLLRVSDNRYGQVALQSWRYGSQPSDYQLRQCEQNLKPGLYSVHVLGSGVGVRRFAIEAGGRARATTPRCE